jgi:hypothetical protein
MRLNTLFKEVITREIPMDAAEAADLKAELDKEYHSIQWSESYLKGLADEGESVPIKTRIKILSENVYVRVILAGVYLWISRWVRDLKNARPENTEDGDDDGHNDEWQL